MAGVTGVGTKLQRYVNAAWADVALLFSISGPSITRETIDTTTFDNTDSFRDFITGLRDGGTLSFEMLFTKAGYAAMKTDFLLNAAVAYTITLPDVDSTVITFNGLVTGFPLNVPLADTIKISVTIKVVGDITIA